MRILLTLVSDSPEHSRAFLEVSGNAERPSRVEQPIRATIWPRGITWAKERSSKASLSELRVT